MPIRTIVADTVDWSWPLVAPLNWHMDSAYAHSGLVNVACNVWGEYAGASVSLVSPRIYLPENKRVNFWWKLGNGDLSNVDVFFDISTDGGDSWENLQHFQPDAPMSDFDQSLINLFGYEGNNVHFRWRYESLANYVSDYFYLDDLTIENAPTGAVIQIEEPVINFLPLAVGGETYLPLEITNIGSQDLVISGSTISAPFSYDFSDVIAPGTSETIYVTMNATSQGNFNQTFNFTGDFEGNANVQLSGSVYQPDYDFFQNADISLEMPENWNIIRTPDPLHPEAFVAIETFEMTTTYQEFEVEFPSSTTTPYIVFNYLGGAWSGATIWLDDISWDLTGTYPPYCPEIIYPSPASTDVDVMMGLELNWTSGGGNPTGYKLSIGTNPEATNIIDGVDIGDVLTYNFPITPEYSTQYYWRVAAYNLYGESAGCAINSFTIMDNPLLTVPFSENFDAMNAFGDRDYPLCWSIENANNDNFPWDLISNVVAPDVVHSAPNAMHMLFSLNTMDDYLFTPPLDLQAGVGYQLSFWYKTMGDMWVPNPTERMKVLVGNNNTGAAMYIEVFNNSNISNQNWVHAEAGFTVENSGEYFIAFYGYSNPNQGLLLLDDVQVDFYTGVNEASQNSLSLYPNPAKDKLQIVGNDAIKQVKIMGMDGKTVYNQSYNETNISLGIEDLVDGVYIIFIELETSVIREKLIVR